VAALTLYGPVLTDDRELPPSRVEMGGGRILAVVSDASSAGADLVVDNGWIAPGLIDLQVNGAGGVDLTSAAHPAEAVAVAARTLAQHGITAFCPTIVSSPPETILSRLAAFGPRAHPLGAESLGAHLEGPFINPAYRGVHDPAGLRPPDSREIERWLALMPPAIVTLAPELPGALDAIRRLVAVGVSVSLGHSGADTAGAQAGLAAGARMGTHLFNAMPPLHHRRPGLVGVLLTSAATLTLIADGAHVDPLVVAVAVRAAGVERVALVSDALAPAGAATGPGALGSQPIVSDGRVVRRADGTLAGSAVLLDACLRHARAWLPWLPPAQVLRMATRTPAEALGERAAARKGRVAPGYDADLVVLDAAWNVAHTIVRGEVVAAPPATVGPGRVAGQPLVPSEEGVG